MKTVHMISCAAFSVVLLSASSCDPTADGAVKIIKDCAATDLVKSSQIIYTGPVGSGPGTRWIIFNNGYSQIAADVKDMFGREIPEAIASRPASGTNCNLNTERKLELGVDMGVTIATLPVSSDLKSKIGNSKKVVSTIDGFEWRTIKFDVYNQLIEALPASSPYKQPGPGRMTAVSMLQVKGYTASVDVGSSTELGLTAGYTGPLPAALIGDVKGKINAAITSSGKLVISIPGEVYIAGIFRPVSGNGKTESSAPAVQSVEKSIQSTDVEDRRL